MGDLRRGVWFEPRLFGGWVILTLWIFLALSPPLSGQTLLERPPGISTIEFERLVTFGDALGPGYIGLPAQVVRDRHGNWVVTDQNNQNEIKVFSSEGKWLRTIGRSGEGPGEFAWALGLSVGADGGLRVFDPFLQRITDYDSLLNVVGITKLKTPPMGLTFLPGGGLVGVAELNGPDQIGLPLHLLDSEGRLVRSFGADPPIQDRRDSPRNARMLAPAGPRSVWSAHLTDYEIERWTVEGVRTHHFVGDVPWFEPQDQYGLDFEGSRPPNPGIYRIHMDKRGLLWIGIRVPDPKWRDGLEEVRGPGGRTRLISSDENLTYDTVFEVIDPALGAVVATGRHSSAIWGFTNEDHLVFHRFLADGTPVCEIWQARF